MDRALFTLALIAVAALGLAACTGGAADTPEAGGAMPAVDATAVPAVDDTTSADTTAEQFNEADVAFAQAMIPHHEQAVTMADTALDPARGAGPDVLDLAARIQQAQGPEIELMTGWLTAWGQPVESAVAGMGGMMAADVMGGLGEASGADFDRMWLETMIQHHEGAVVAAEQIKTTGASAEVKALADQIISTQQAEIDEMKALLGG